MKKQLTDIIYQAIKCRQIEALFGLIPFTFGAFLTKVSLFENRGFYEFSEEPILSFQEAF